MANDIGGVWRTIGGRRVFIKDGQDLASAMKESGKFKSTKKNENKKDHTFNMSEEDKKKYEKVGKKIDDLTKEIEQQKNQNENQKLKQEAKDVIKQLNDEGSDFTFGDVTIEDGKIKTDVSVFMPDERGYTTRELEIPIDDKEDFTSLESKLRDWEDRHRSVESWEAEDFPKNKSVEKDSKTGLTDKENAKNQKEREEWLKQEEQYNKEAVEEWSRFKDKAQKSLDRSTNPKSKETFKKDVDTAQKEIDKAKEYLSNKEYEKGEKYRNSITETAKNSKEDNVTLDTETGKVATFDKGYSVSFQQSSDNYDDKEYYEKVEECRNKCDGKLYAGKYGGDAEASFHTDDIETAKELMYKYNQESIYDWKHETLIMNDKYDASSNKTNYEAEKTTTNSTMNNAIRDKANKRKISYQKGYSKDGSAISQNVKITSNERDNINEAIKKEIEAGYPNYEKYANDKNSARMYLEELGKDNYKDTNNTTNRFVKNYLGEDKIKTDRNTRYLEAKKTTNDVMNKAIRSKADKDDLPKHVEIKSQGTSNRKEVSENIQAHILEHYDKPEDFIEQMDVFNNLPTKWHAGEEMAKQGFYDIYYDDQRKFLDDLKINPKGKKFSDDRVFQTYTSLIGRESAKLYDRLKKNSYKKYLKAHPLSKMTFAEFKDMKKGDD